jgi:DNA polymerase/3'-5' exonuclease PolX
MAKTKHTWAAAAIVAKDLTDKLKPHTRAMTFVGSLRRRCAEVSDIEFVYIPARGPVRDGLFVSDNADLFEWHLAELIANKVLTKRENDRGVVGYGPRNKFLVHTASGIPVDVFQSTDSGWWSYLVCRTGPKESNIAIAEAASKLGMRWDPTKGFQEADFSWFHPTSEEEVFTHVGLEFKEPKDR